MLPAYTTPRLSDNQLKISKTSTNKFKSFLIHRIFNRGYEYDIRGF